MDDTFPPEPREVGTVGITKDADGDLILIIDGVEARLPAGNASASVGDDGKIGVSVYANFFAQAVDVTRTPSGS